MPRPDFSGRWLNTAYESPDVEAFYRDGMKVGWMACQAAKAANYGCGKLMHTIKAIASIAAATPRGQRKCWRSIAMGAALRLVAGAVG